MSANDKHLYQTYLEDETLTPIYCDSRFVSIIEEDLQKSNMHNALVSRIDSDDLISKHYFSNLNKQCNMHKKKLTVACCGYRSDLKTIQSIFSSTSAFITQNLTSSDMIEIYDFNHINIWQKDHQQIHTAEWMQIIHGKNISNNFSIPSNFGYNRSGGNSFSPQVDIDAQWFKEWSGFALPDQSIIGL